MSCHKGQAEVENCPYFIQYPAGASLRLVPNRIADNYNLGNEQKKIGNMCGHEPEARASEN
ncbi:hypothetical protein [Rufibacter roseolus]|uniref:hypothetical protein n=1 Tax=Rufibacter roseolus TaxID=2817375 RepID=UPI001B3116C9|nr:hypothetical protein [Rufibacter roseolus]